MPLSIYQPISAPPQTPTPISIRQSEQWIWISPGNISRELTRFVDGSCITKGMTGRYAPPVAVQRDVIPGMPGARIRDIRHDVREIDIPLFVLANEYVELQALISQMVRDFDPVAGVGTLRHIAADGTVSDLFCRCMGGLGIDGEGSMGPIAHQTTLVFQADDPYWYGEFVSTTFGGGPPVNWFNILPLRLGTAHVIGDAEVNNIGDVKAWPVWTIQGPGINPIFTNNLTGESLALAVTLDTTDRVTIDTRPGLKSVTGPNSQNWRRYLTSRNLWGIYPGINEISLRMVNTTSSSYISMSYRPPFLVPGGLADIKPDVQTANAATGSSPLGTYSGTYAGSYS